MDSDIEVKLRESDMSEGLEIRLQVIGGSNFREEIRTKVLNSQSRIDMFATIKNLEKQKIFCHPNYLVVISNCQSWSHDRCKVLGSGIQALHQLLIPH